MFGRISQTPSAARDFYSRKVEEVGKNLLDLEKIVQGKQGNLAVVEDGEFSFCAPLLVFNVEVVEKGKGGPM